MFYPNFNRDRKKKNLVNKLIMQFFPSIDKMNNVRMYTIIFVWKSITNRYTF